MKARVAGVTSGVLLLTSSAVVASEHPADVCLEVTAGSVAVEDWRAVAASVSESVAQRTALFPTPQLDQALARIDIDSGHLGGDPGHAGCLKPGAEWTARFGRADNVHVLVVAVSV